TDVFQEAFRWTRQTGIENLLQVLTSRYGVDTTGWFLEYAYGISPDGTTIGGQGAHFGPTEGFGAILPAPCLANCDQSTTTPALTIADFTCFLNRFAAGDSRANCDGSTTLPTLNVGDFACFLNAFAAGCQ